MAFYITNRKVLYHLTSNWTTTSEGYRLLASKLN
jgi:hypothetical protein